MTTAQLDLTTPRVNFFRLVGVEFRKMFDTRAGLAYGSFTVAVLLLVTLIASSALAALQAYGSAPSLKVWVYVLLVTLSILLPVFPIMVATAEWTQRTGLTTFTLEPVRIKVLAAKFVAVLGLSVITLAVALAIAAAANGIFSGPWDADPGFLGVELLRLALFFMVAFAVAALTMNTVAALWIYYLAAFLGRFIFAALIGVSEAWDRLGPSLDLNLALDELSGRGISRHALFGSGPSSESWVHVAIAATIWVIIPLVFGVIRWTRAEVK